MEIEFDARFVVRFLLVVFVLFFAVVYAVGAAHTEHDAEGRAMLLSRDLLQTQTYLKRADELARELNRIASALDGAVEPPETLGLPHPSATPVVRPGQNASTLLENVRTVTHLLRRIQAAAVDIERLNPPPALAPVHERLKETARAMARWGTAVADYVTAPSEGRWKKVRKERREALRLLGEVRGALK